MAGDSWCSNMLRKTTSGRKCRRAARSAATAKGFTICSTALAANPSLP